MLELLKTKKRILGRVKWFNSKLGYGFITHRNRVEDVDVDVFVHWSNLQLSEKEYHTLYKGEFVEFEINHVYVIQIQMVVYKLVKYLVQTMVNY